MLALLRTAVEPHRGPFACAIRAIPSPDVPSADVGRSTRVPYGTWEVLRRGSDVAILAVGTMVNPSLAAAEALAAEGFERHRRELPLPQAVRRGDARRDPRRATGRCSSSKRERSSTASARTWRRVIERLDPSVRVAAHGVPDRIIHAASRARQLAIVRARRRRDRRARARAARERGDRRVIRLGVVGTPGLSDAGAERPARARRRLAPDARRSSVHSRGASCMESRRDRAEPLAADHLDASRRAADPRRRRHAAARRALPRRPRGADPRHQPRPPRLPHLLRPTISESRCGGSPRRLRRRAAHDARGPRLGLARRAPRRWSRSTTSCCTRADRARRLAAGRVDGEERSPVYAADGHRDLHAHRLDGVQPLGRRTGRRADARDDHPRRRSRRTRSRSARSCLPPTREVIVHATTMARASFW